jgi:GntR family transcriptional regulator
VLALTYLPAAMVPGLVDHELGGQESLYRVLREEYGLRILSSVRRVEAIVADSREARLLEVRTGDPLLVLRSVGYTTERRPFDYFIAHHRGDLNAFEVVLPGPTAAVGSFASVPLPEESSK